MNHIVQAPQEQERKNLLFLFFVHISGGMSHATAPRRRTANKSSSVASKCCRISESLSVSLSEKEMRSCSALLRSHLILGGQNEFISSSPTTRSNKRIDSMFHGPKPSIEKPDMNDIPQSPRKRKRKNLLVLCLHL